MGITLLVYYKGCGRPRITNEQKPDTPLFFCSQQNKKLTSPILGVWRTLRNYMSEQSTSRITFVDYAKTMCIFLMVVGHWTTSDILLSYIYSFHMPALFVVSGYLYRPHSWIKTIIGFSIPVVFFSLVNLAVNILLGNNSVS